MSDADAPTQESVWPKVAGYGSTGAVIAAFVANLDKVTPFLDRFGLSVFLAIAGFGTVFWFVSRVVTTAETLGKRAIGSHEKFLDSQTETSRKQNDILEGITKTQAVHGERLDHHTTILEELRRDRGRPCNAAGTVSQGGN